MIDQKTIDGLRGKRLAGLARISDAGSSEINSQKAPIEALARQAGNSIWKFYEDADRKRWQYNNSKVLRQIMDDAEARLFDVLIVDKQQRIGTDGPNELFHFLHEMKMRGVGVVSAAEGDLMLLDIAAKLNQLLGSESERKEQTNKSQNVLRGMLDNAKAGRFNGGITPYAFDRICVNRAGEERYRLIEEFRTHNPDYEPGSKDWAKRRYIHHYTVVYPGGREEKRTDLPGKGEHERYEYRVSIRVERVEAVKTIFALNAEGVNLYQIAKHMNDGRVDLGFKVRWTYGAVLRILTNPIYGGRLEWMKTSSAVYATINTEGTYGPPVEVQGVRMYRKSRINPAESRLVVPLPSGDAIVSSWDSAAAPGLQRRVRGGPQVFAPKMWLRKFTVCGHCGKTMHCRQRGVDYPFFLCGSWVAGAFGGGRTCMPCRVRVSDVEEALALFLESYGMQAEADLERSHPLADRMKVQVRNAGSLLDAMAGEMYDYVADRMPEKDLPLLGQPGGLSVIESYRHYYGMEAGEREKKLKKIEGQIDVILDELLSGGHAKGSLSRQKLEQRSATLQADHDALSAENVPLDQRLDQVHRQIQEITDSIRAARDFTAARKYAQAANTIGKFLARIEVHSLPHPRDARLRIAEKLIFVPVLGRPAEYPCNTPERDRSSLAAHTAHRLKSEGNTPNRIAAMMTDMGIPTLRGKGTWFRAEVVKLLASDPPSIVPPAETRTSIPLPSGARRRGLRGRGTR